MRHEGDLINFIPDKVNILPEIQEYTCLAVPMISVLKREKWNIVLERLYAKYKAGSFVRRHHLPKDNGVELEYSHKYTKKFMPEISKKKYDLAISFLTPHYFVAEKVIAKQKIAWIHTDYSYVAVDTDSERQMWGKYDHIMSISDACTKGFQKKFPELRSKLVQTENIISPKFIREQASMSDVSNEISIDGSIHLLSVGRFSFAKNFDNVPEICRLIMEQGIQVKWYLIGYGGDEALIRQRIRENHMEQSVIILGKRVNPYPYMKVCDVYVQPSRYEGKCVAVREAQILGRPVVITEYPTAVSQLEDGVDGIIVPMENEKCASAIANLLKEKETLKRVAENAELRNYGNAREIRKLYALMED